MLNEHSCRYHPYSHSELSLIIFRYEIGTGSINKQTKKTTALSRVTYREIDQLSNPKSSAEVMYQ